jgi:hypothetical protein
MPQPHSPSFLMNIVLPLGEEVSSQRIALQGTSCYTATHRDAPPYIPNSCMHSGKAARGLSGLSTDIDHPRHFCWMVLLPKHRSTVQDRTDY